MGRKPGIEDSEAKKKLLKRNGAFLKGEREKAGRTQQHLSIAIGLTTAQYVSNIERGISPASPEYLRTFRALTGINKTYLISVLKENYGKYLIGELTPL